MFGKKNMYKILIPDLIYCQIKILVVYFDNIRVCVYSNNIEVSQFIFIN